jgi:hypothetical protein
MLVDRPSIGEINGLPEGYERPLATRTVYWNEPGLRISRLRLLSDPGFPFWDVSYCEGYIGKEFVNVTLPFDSLPKKNKLKAIVDHAKKDKVFAKKIGILNPFVISTLC